MPKTIRDLYEESLKYEQVSLAYYIYQSLQEGLVNLEDADTALFKNQIDNSKLNELIERNPLGFNPMKVFALKVEVHKFAFVFATNPQEAVDYVNKELKTKPLNCHEYSMDYPMSRGNQFLSFREMKKEFSSFPALIGVYERDLNYL